MSISINNFSMGLGDVALCTSLVDFNVEVTDSSYTVTTSGTYFTENGIVVSGTLTPITDGYLLSYITVPSGNMLLTAHGSNDNDEFYSQDFELTYGYQATWEDVNNWPPRYEVPIAVSASNTSLASNTSYFSTFFETRGFMDNDLEVFITAEGSGHTDFTGSIEPRSKHFMYGKTYSITISGVQDYSGNVLPAFTYSFTIEEIN